MTFTSCTDDVALDHRRFCRGICTPEDGPVRQEELRQLPLLHRRRPATNPDRRRVAEGEMQLRGITAVNRHRQTGQFEGCFRACPEYHVAGTAGVQPDLEDVIAFDVVTPSTLCIFYNFVLHSVGHYPSDESFNEFWGRVSPRPLLPLPSPRKGGYGNRISGRREFVVLWLRLPTSPWTEALGCRMRREMTHFQARLMLVPHRHCRYQ